MVIAQIPAAHQVLTLEGLGQLVPIGSSAQDPRKEYHLKKGVSGWAGLREFLEGKARNLGDDVINARLGSYAGVSRVMSFLSSSSR